MGIKNLNKSCCGNKTEPTRLVEKSGLCPICEEEGKLVKNITVKYMVLKKVEEQVGDNDYYICMNETCPVVYFNQESDIKFNKNEVKVPIWFKKDANPKYVCYCNKVTEEQILDAVVNKDAKNLNDIIASKICSSVTLLQ